MTIFAREDSRTIDMTEFGLIPFEFDEIDNFCIASRMRIDADPRIIKIREVARRSISHSEILFASFSDAVSGLAHTACKLLEREYFDGGDKNDVSLVIALLATEYRQLPTVDKGRSYETVFKDCYDSYWSIVGSPISSDTIAQLEEEVDRIVFENSMYNTYLFMEEYLNAAFQVMSSVSSDRADCARELARHLDSKRDGVLPRGETWQSIVSKILYKSNCLQDAINLDFHLDAKEDLHIYDTCHNPKQVEYSEAFLLEIADAFIKNEQELDIQNAVNQRVFHKTSNYSPVLVYDRRHNVIDTDYSDLSDNGRVAIRCIGSVNDYISCCLEVFGFSFSNQIGKIYQLVGIHDDDEKQLSASALLCIESTTARLLGITPEDAQLRKTRAVFVKRWLDFRVALELCHFPKSSEDIEELFYAESMDDSDLPQYEQEDFENHLDQYFFESAYLYGFNFYRYLDYSIPVLDAYDTKKRFPRKAYAKAMVEYFFYHAQGIHAEDTTKKKIVRILSQKNTCESYKESISEFL